MDRVQLEADRRPSFETKPYRRRVGRELVAKVEKITGPQTCLSATPPGVSQGQLGQSNDITTNDPNKQQLEQ
jgi:hypothetical protein